MKPIRILWVISSLSAGGAERMISELANAFAERSHVVSLLTLSATDDDHYRLNSQVERIALNVMWDSPSIWQKIKGNLRRNRMIRDAVRNCQPDVVVSFIEQNNIRILAATLGYRAPVIVSERTDPRHHYVGTAWKVARRMLYPFASRVVVQTEDVGKWAETTTSRQRVRVIPNFVRTLPCLHLNGTREQMRILAVGRLDRAKGFDILLRAFALNGLSERGIRLTILGEGPERRTLEKLAAELNIEYAVEMPGVVQDPESWMVRASVYVLPSRYEGFPNVLLEAMAMGCPVIAADCDSGPREIIQHGENGLLIPVDDVAALAEALQELLDDKSMRERLGAEALKVRERYAKDAIVRQWEELINELVE